MMRDNELDSLDVKILEIITKKRHLTADEIYTLISGFSQGKFGRSLISLKIQKLAKMGHIQISILPGYKEERFSYSISKRYES